MARSPREPINEIRQVTPIDGEDLVRVVIGQEGGGGAHFFLFRKSAARELARKLNALDL
jgi:signal transduction histidine kinase